MTTKAKVNTTLMWQGLADSYYPPRALARAGSGRLWTVYSWDTSQVLASYSDDNGRTWTEEPVATAVNQANLGIHILVDSADVPHILWVDYSVPGGNSNLIEYTNRVGGVWAAPVTIYNAGANNIMSINVGIDPTDVIHLAFRHSGVANALYMSRVGGVWGAAGATTLVTNISNGLDIDSLLIPHVVGENWGAGTLEMARLVGGIWQVPEIIAAVGPWGASISFDSSDNLHIAWLGGPGPNTTIQYRRRNNAGVWGAIIDAIDEWNGITNPFPPVLTVDSGGNVYIITQKNNWSGVDESTVYYKKISAAGVLGPLTIFDAAITRPGGRASPYTSLFHGGSNNSLLPPAYHPVGIVLNENGADADGFFERQSIGIKGNPNVDQLMYQHVERMD